MADYRLFPTNPVPFAPDAGYAGAITVGSRFKVTAAASATQVWFYKAPAGANPGTHIGAIWDAAGTLQGSVTFTGETASGWQSATFSPPIALTVGAYYVVGVYMPTGHFARSLAAGADHSASITNGPLYAPTNAESSPQPCHTVGTGLQFPTAQESTNNYGIDVTVSDTAPRLDSVGLQVDIAPPAVADSRLDSIGLQVDITLAGIVDRRLDSILFQVDLAERPPSGPAWYPTTAAAQVGALLEEVAFAAYQVTPQLANKWWSDTAPVVPIEVVIWAATEFDEAMTGPGVTPVRWTGTAFTEAGDDPLVQWDGSAFQPHEE